MSDDLLSWLREQFDADDDGASDIHVSTCDFFPYDTCNCGMPEWIRADIASKRRVIGAHIADIKGHCRTCAHWTSDWVDGIKVNRIAYEGVRSPCLTLRLLALPYADRPRYLPDWRP